MRVGAADEASGGGRQGIGSLSGYHLYYPVRLGTTAFELFKEALRAHTYGRG